jgi:hypothetical protein
MSSGHLAGAGELIRARESVRNGRHWLRFASALEQYLQPAPGHS